MIPNHFHPNTINKTIGLGFLPVKSFIHAVSLNLCIFILRM